jgi:transcriptional regulator with AAA-type ATPase domain
MEIRVLVLDDDASSVSPLITDALKPFLADDFKLSEFALGQPTPLILTRILPVNISVSFVSTDFYDSTTDDVLKKIDSGLFNTSLFDLVLLDDNWQDQDFGGQDTLLPVVYSKIKGSSEYLPMISLFTRHWNNERIVRFHKIVQEKGMSWRRLVPCDKNDPLQLLHLFHRVIAEKALILEKESIVQRARVQGADVDSKLPALNVLGDLIGGSWSMRQVYDSISRVAPSKANVLIRGESGTGKELVANAIHKMSPRADRPFIKFNCASIPEGLLESELFGHEKGSFTGAAVLRKGRFELADSGTIFLDEIGDLPLTLQPKILRVLQEKEFERVGGEKTIKVDVRLVAATSRNLEDLVREDAFREDLYYRLNVVPIYLPALRQRREDIPLLQEYFLNKYNRENTRAVQITPEVLNIIMNYDWPGNVRELENTVERLVVMSGGKTVTKADLPTKIQKQFPKDQDVFVTLDESNWVDLWQAQLRKSKGKFTSNDIIKGYPSFASGSLIDYHGTGYAGYGVLLHLAVSLGGWTKLGEVLKNNEEPRGKLTKAANDLLNDLANNLGADKKDFKVCFLFGNKGFKQVASSNPGGFCLTLDYDIDFILVNTKTTAIFAPKDNNLQELISINDSIDDKIKTIIYEATKTKSGRSASSSKDTPSRKK